MNYPHFDVLEPRRLFAGGAADDTFGTDGSVSVSFNTRAQESVYVKSVLADSSGRSYVVARTSFFPQDSFRVRRLDADGKLDTTWAAAKNGLLKFSVDSGATNGVFVVDRSDRLIVAELGRVYRYNADGTPDATFGTRGSIAISGFGIIRHLSIDAGGRLYLSGQSAPKPATSGQPKAVLMRLNARGAIDRTFANRGTFTLQDYTAERRFDTIGSGGVESRPMADGVVFVATAYFNTGDPANGRRGIAVVRLRSNGGPDADYGTDGYYREYAPARRTDGRRSVIEVSAARIRPDGSVLLRKTYSARGGVPTTLLDADGRSQTPAGPAVGLGARFIDQADGSTLVYNGALTRVNANGTNDATFGSASGGTGSVADVDAAALQYDGTVVVADSTGNYGPIVVRRIFRDDAPIATLTARRLKTPGTSYSFSVVYRGPNGIQTPSITGNELRVIGADGTARRPRLVQLIALAEGAVRAYYKTTDVAGQAWDASDNGTYAVRILGGQVRDDGGIFVAKRTVGTFSVAIG